jgi:hypothetical protein
MTTQVPIKYTASPKDPVAIAAFQEWLAAGRPQGRDNEFWKRAEDRAGDHESAEARPSTVGACTSKRAKVKEHQP